MNIYKTWCIQKFNFHTTKIIVIQHDVCYHILILIEAATFFHLTYMLNKLLSLKIGYPYKKLDFNCV